jgi:uncharacterized protein YjbI with pentapeptide repeats
LSKTTQSSELTTNESAVFEHLNIRPCTFAPSQFEAKTKTTVEMVANFIGNKIAEARKKMNLSQAQLAERLFISPQAVGKWERGESIPDILTCIQVADILGLDLNYFSEKFQSISSPKLNEPEQTESLAPLQTGPKKKASLNWEMSSGNWIDADFSGLNGLKDKFSSSNMKNCRFIGSELSDLMLKGNNIVGCDFSNSDLRNSKIQASDLARNNFTGCSFIDAVFSSSEIGNCEFSNASLSGAEFHASEFYKCTLTNAIWNLTSFKHTHLADLVFNGSIENCAFDHCSFSKVRFQNARIINTFFKSKKLKGIQFIDCQLDRMTYEFLKNGKADLEGVTVIPAS